MKKIFLIILFIFLLSILGFIYTLNNYNNKIQFDKPVFDKLAQEGVPTVASNLEYKELSPEGLYSISLCAKPKLENNNLKIYLTSSKDNNVYIKARIIKNDKIVGESGLIKPNEYIENIKVKDLKENDHISIKIMGYEPENYYSAGTINIDLEME